MKWHKFPEEQPAEDNNYLVYSIYVDDAINSRWPDIAWFDGENFRIYDAYNDREQILSCVGYWCEIEEPID